jgi:hypothetical protein
MRIAADFGWNGFGMKVLLGVRDIKIIKEAAGRCRFQSSSTAAGENKFCSKENVGFSSRILLQKY